LFPDPDYRGDRNLVLCLPRLAVLVSIEADRPGAWISCPLGPYAAWFPGIGLSRNFERAKVPGNPMKGPFCFGVFCFFFGGGKILAITIFARRQPNSINLLMSGLCNLLKGAFYLLLSSPGDPRGVRCSHLCSEFRPRYRFSVDRNQRQGSTAV
jgi:hypothetical protein